MHTWYGLMVQVWFLDFGDSRNDATDDARADEMAALRMVFRASDHSGNSGELVAARQHLHVIIHDGL